MVDIIETTRFTEDELPIVNSADVDGVTVYGYVDYTDTLFQNDDKPRVEFASHSFTDNALDWEFYPYGDSGSTTFSLMFFDGNGSYLGEFESRDCGYSDGCELGIGFEYDFSGSTNVLSTIGNTPDRSDITFNTDNLLVSYRFDDVPEDWVELLEGDEAFVRFLEYPSGTHCDGEEIDYTFEVESTSLQDYTFNATVITFDQETEEEEDGSVDWMIGKRRVIGEYDDIDLPAGETVEISDSFNIQRPINEYHPDKVDSFDLSHIEVGVSGFNPTEYEDVDDFEINVYEHSGSEINTDVSVDEDEVFVGEDYLTTAIISNNSDCPVGVDIYLSEYTITIQRIDGSDTEDETFTLAEGEWVESGESLEVEYEATAPDSSGGQDYRLVVEDAYDGNVLDRESFDVQYIGESDVISIGEMSVDGSSISGEDVDVSVEVNNTSDKRITVDIFSDDNEVDSNYVSADSSREFSFSYTLPDVSSETEHSVDVEARVDDEIADSESSVVDVMPLTDAVSIDEVILPSSVSSGETIGSRDATVRVKSDIDGIYVDINKDEERLTTEEIRRVGVEDMGVEFTAPDVDETKDVTVEFDVVVDGDVADSATSDMTVEAAASDITIDYIDSPSDLMSGDTEEISVGVTNGGDDSQSVSLEYDGDSVAREDIRGGRSKQFTFDFTAPDVDEESDVDISLSAVVDGTVGDTKTETVTIGTISGYIEINSLTAPSSVYVEEEYSVEFNVLNDYTSTLDLDIEIDGSVVDTVTVRSGRESEVSILQTAPSADSISTDIVVSYGGDIVVEESLSIEVTSPDLAIDSIDYPSDVCAGGSISVTTSVENQTNESRSVFVVIESDQFDTKEEEIEDISRSRSSDATISYDVPQDIDASSATFDVIVEYDGESLVEVDSDSFFVSMNRPSVDIDTVDIPNEAMPGEVSGSVTVRNSSECDANINIAVSGQNNTSNISSGSTDDIDVSFTLGTSQRELDIEVVNDDTGNVYDSERHTVTPINYMEINTEEDNAYILNKYDSSLDIEGQVAGRNVEVSEEVKSEFDVLPNIAGTSFSGEVESSDSEERVVKSDDLRFVNVGSNEEIAWVIDGEVEDVSKSFRYSTAGMDGYIPDDELQPRNARTEVRGGILSGIGLIRYRLGLK